MKVKKKLNKLLSILLALVMVVGMLPAMSLKAYAVNASSVTITESDGTQTVITETIGTDGDPWSYDEDTATLTLNNWTGQKISANGDLNLHLVGTNTITIPSSTSEVIGIKVGSDSSMSYLTITADTGGTLNINGTTEGNFYGIRAHTYITNGTVNIDITSSGSTDSYGMWGNVYFTEEETRQATLNVKVTDTGTTKTGYLSALGNGSIYVNNRSNVTINAEAHVSSANKSKSVALSSINIYEASPVITATADCPEEASTECIAVENLSALGLTEGGKVTTNGMVKTYSLPAYLDANVVTTTPADNNYLFRRGTDLGNSDTYYYMCGIDGSILNNAVFEYSEEAADFKWVGGSCYDIPGGMVGDRISNTIYLLAGLRGADGLYDSTSKTKFEILSGSLPSGLTLHEKGGIYGTVSAPCEAGSVTVKATDTNDSTRTATFTINYGAFVSQNPVTGMTLDKTEIILEKGATANVTATVTPSDASYPNVKAVSSNTGIATVSVGTPSGASSTVQVTAGYNPGKATVTITSVDSSLQKTFDVYVKENTPNAGINYYNEELTGLVSGATYSVSGDGITTESFTATESIYAIKAEWIGKSIKLVRTNTETKCNSDAQIIEIPARPATPTGVAAVNESYEGAGDGKITGVDSSMEYRVSGADSWSSIYSGTINYLAKGTYEVRYCAAGSSFAGEAALLTVGTEPLSFEDSVTFDIPAGETGASISQVDLSGAVSGGTRPYTFTKESGPDWLQVSTGGCITGTRPTAVADATTAVIKVTDNTGTSKTIEIAIGAVTVATTKYSISVTDGMATNSGVEIIQAVSGTAITVVADSAPAGTKFEKWVVCEGSAEVVFTDATASTTTFSMPSGDVIIKAQYVDVYVEVTVSGTITSKGNAADSVTLYLYIDGETNPVKTCTVTGNTASYSFTGVEGRKNYYIVAVKTGNKVLTSAVFNSGVTDISGYNLTMQELPAPSITSITNSWYGLTVKWSNVSGATGYELYSRVKGTTTWNKVATTTATSYYDKSAVNGKTYEYMVKTKSGAGISLAGEVKEALFLAPPTISSVENLSTGVKITWSENSSATGYYVYRKDTQAGTWHFIGGTKSLSYTDTTVENGVVYYYAVKAYSGSVISASSSAKNTIYVKNVFISSLTNPSTRAMLVKYSSNSKATGYEIAYSPYPTMGPASTKTITVTGASNLSKTITSLNNGSTYYVKVRAYKTVAGYKFYSSWSAVKSIKITK